VHASHRRVVPLAAGVQAKSVAAAVQDGHLWLQLEPLPGRRIRARLLPAHP